VVLGEVVITNSCLSNFSFLASSEYDLNCAKILSLFWVIVSCGISGGEAFLLCCLAGDGWTSQASSTGGTWLSSTLCSRFAWCRLVKGRSGTEVAGREGSMAGGFSPMDMLSLFISSTDVAAD
jgi:hypothetical protein